jgi:hypothetical protein
MCVLWGQDYVTWFQDAALFKTVHSIQSKEQDNLGGRFQ